MAFQGNNYTPLITPVTPTKQLQQLRKYSRSNTNGHSWPFAFDSDAIAPIKQGSAKLLDKEGMKFLQVDNPAMLKMDYRNRHIPH